MILGIILKFGFSNNITVGGNRFDRVPIIVAAAETRSSVVVVENKGRSQAGSIRFCISYYSSSNFSK